MVVSLKPATYLLKAYERVRVHKCREMLMLMPVPNQLVKRGAPCRARWHCESSRAVTLRVQLHRPILQASAIPDHLESLDVLKEVAQVFCRILLLTCELPSRS